MKFRRRSRKETKNETKNETESVAIPRRPAIYESKMVINQPIFVDKGGKKERIRVGEPIAEIFEVHLNAMNNNCKKGIKIHGVVYAKCGGFRGRVNIFERHRLNPQIIHHKGKLELMGPGTALIALDQLWIYFRVMHGRNELLDLYMVWDPMFDPSDTLYNEEVYDRGNSVRTSFIVYESAVVATVEIKFKPNCCVEIGGTITSSNNLISKRNSVLFCKKEEGFILQEKGEEKLIPLLRSVTAVPVSSVRVQQCPDENERPVDGCLSIHFNLVNMRDEEGAIAQGDLKFPIENLGDYIGTISSKYGEMQVKVYFQDIFRHWPTDAYPTGTPMTIDQLLACK